jgi:hypothetical protein
MSKLLITNICIQITILLFALFQNWDPYLLFFVYVSELIFATIGGIINSVRFGGITHLPISIFSGVIVIGMAMALIFAAANILQPFSVTDVPNEFIKIILMSITTTWLTLIGNSITVLLAAIKDRNTIDPFFQPLKALVRLIPLFPVVIFGGFLAILGFSEIVIIGMVIAHIVVDILLYKHKAKS